MARSSGYELARTETRTGNRTVSVVGRSREARVTSHLAEYQETVDLGPLGEYRAAVFVVLATPTVNVLGRTFNPVGDTSSVELVRLVQSRYEGFTVGVETRNATMLGRETEVTEIAGTAALAVGRVDVFVHVARVEREGDDFVAEATYPQVLSGEEATVLTLLRGVEH